MKSVNDSYNVGLNMMYKLYIGKDMKNGVFYFYLRIKILLNMVIYEVLCVCN